MLGTRTPINLVKATVTGLQGLRKPEEVAELRGLSVNAVLGLAAEERGRRDDRRGPPADRARRGGAGRRRGGGGRREDDQAWA